MSAVRTEPDRAPAERGVFVALGHLVVGHRRLVLVLFALGVLGSAFLGGPVLGALKTAGYDDPTSESAQAQAALDDQFGVQEPVIALAVQTPAGLDDPDAARQAVALVGAVGEVPGVTSTVSYWTSGRPEALAGVDGLTGPGAGLCRGNHRAGADRARR